MPRTKENPPKIHNADGSPTGNSDMETLFVATPGFYREDWNAFQAKCDTDSIHVMDKIRSLVTTYAPRA